ncbi:MAG: response regulator [Proteobacteria bacterium]|nr:response regulator [Pseudomonadota bacterium]
MPSETVLVIDDSPTILKVVQLVLTKARFRVETALDGESGLSLARDASPALILLDFVMPGMNGYQLCRELAADPQLKDIPVVLMSAKGDQVGERLVKVMGIVDYITKPFSPEAITAVVQHTIAKYARKSPSEDTLSVLDVANNRAEADPREDRKLAEELGETKASALADIRDRLTRALVTAADQGSGAQWARLRGEEGDGRADGVTGLADLVDTSLDDDTLLAILSSAEHVLAASDHSPSLRGDLHVVPLAEVLQLLDVQEQSGILSVRQARGKIEVYFRRGRVDLAMASGISEEFLLGRFVVQSELMTQTEFDTFLDERPLGAKLIGAQLIKLGYLSEQDLKAILKKQTSELIYEALRWSHGSFHFTATRELPHAALDASLGLDVEAVLMEGFRRVDEWHLIEREVDNFDLVFLRNEDAVAHMGPGRLTREESAIIGLVNGKNTVKDIVRRSRMGSFDVSKILYRLLSIKLIRRRVVPVAV